MVFNKEYELLLESESPNRVEFGAVIAPDGKEFFGEVLSAWRDRAGEPLSGDSDPKYKADDRPSKIAETTANLGNNYSRTTS